MTRAELEAAIAASRYVICHAGSGLIAAALRAGRKPLVLARRTALGEHVDDHQSQLLERLAAANLIVPVEHEIEPSDLEAARAPARPSPELAGAPAISDVVGRWLDSVVLARSA